MHNYDGIHLNPVGYWKSKDGIVENSSPGLDRRQINVCPIYPVCIMRNLADSIALAD